MLFQDIKQSKEILPLTELQKKMFAAVTLNQCDYLISVRIFCAKEIDAKEMEKALFQLMGKQQALHTIFRNTSQKGPVQVVLSEYVPPFYVDTDVPTPSVENEPWNLSLNTSDNSLLLQYCHIVMDGWSMAVFWRELLDGYNAFLEARNPVFSDAKSIKEYQILLNKDIRFNNNQNLFWERVLSEKACLLSDVLRPISVLSNFNDYGDTVKVILEKNEVTSLRRLSSKLKVTPAVIFYAAWHVLLHQLTGQDDISESIVLSGRNSLNGWNNTIGMFIQTVVYNQKTPALFESLCYNIRDFLENHYVNSCNAGMECQKVLDKSGVSSITDTLIAIENYPVEDALLANEKLSVLRYEYNESASYPFTLLVTSGDSVEISLKTSIPKFRPNLKVLIDAFLSILEQVGNGCNEIESLTCTNPATIMGRWGSYSDNSSNQVLSDIIRNSCIFNSRKVAIVCGSDSITYKELYERVLAVAGNLQKIGIKPGDAVGVAISRSIEQLISVYAIIMVGAIYIPFGNLPYNRANYMINQADIKYVIGIEEKPNWNCKWVCYDEFSSFSNNYNEVELSSDSIAYILFTSGSTGNPKGCAISHKSIINRLIWNMNELKLDSEVRQVFKTPVTFDVSLVEIFSLFFSGHKLYILPENTEKMPDYILDFLEENEITYAHFVPSMLRSLLNYSEEFGANKKLESLKTLVCSGEILPSSLVERALCVCSPSLRMVNLYGPTEAAVDVSYYNCTVTNSLVETPVGKPIDNTGLLILNSCMQELPTGIEGELYILGRNVGLGYVNNEDLTKSRFCNIEGYPAFRTGDMAYRLKSGDIVVTGRSDGQVKYNGIRIETAEIEHHILESGISQNAFVFLDKQNSGMRLVACCCCDSKKEDDIREHLQKVLPQNMMPGNFFFVDKFPVSQHGKTDFNLLKKMFAETNTTIDNPVESTELESDLSKIWNNILSTDKIYTGNDHFFEVGGNSLLLVQLLIEIKKKWDIKIDSSMIYENPTIAEISNIIRLNKSRIVNDTRLLGSISTSQKSIFVWQVSNPESTAYNMPVLVELNEACSFEHAENAFLQVINTYEWLHKKYKMKDGELEEYIEKELYHRSDIVLCQNETDLSYLVKPFEMNHSLFRMKKVCYAEKRYIFLDFHHILCDQNVIKFLLDAWSLALSNEKLETIELVMEYGTTDCDSDVDAQYWSNKWENGGWLAFDNLVPINRERQGILSRYSFKCGKMLTDKIDNYCKTHRCSKFQFLFSTFALFCMNAFNLKKISIGTNTTADEFNQHNMQLQVLVLGANLEDKISFDLFVKRIAHDLSEGMKHGGTTIDGLYDIMFIREEDLFKEDSLKKYVKNVRLLNKQTKNPLSLFYRENDSELVFCFDYEESLFEAKLISLYSELYTYLINEIIENSMLDLKNYSLQEAPHLNSWKEEQPCTSHAPSGSSVQELFVQYCENYPDEIVIQGKNEERYTASQVLKKCYGCANKIREYHPKNKLIGICIRDEFDYIVSVFGTLLAGYIFVPFDPEHPISHIQRICENYEISVIISDEPSRFLGVSSVISPCFEEISDRIYIFNEYAYCIFTSGSTGQPKGCLISQENLLNYLSWANEFYCRKQKQCFAFYGSPAVDMTITSTLLPLSFGHKMVLYPNKPESVREIFKNPEISIAKLTPAHLKLLNNQRINSNLKVLIVGGEQLSSALAQSVLSSVGNQLHIYNEYGPTEATVGCMIYEYNPEDTYVSVPIGKAITNMKSYIVDYKGDICLPGTIGELVVEGKSVIGGYINDIEKTESKFQHNGSHWRYRTGDLARMMVDGNIIYEGRADEQYKINGFRIELAEISSIAESIESIYQAQAIMANGHLVLFCVPKNKEEISELLFRKQLFELLPKHMMPSRIIMLESLPVAKSGKLDKNTLIKLAMQSDKQQGRQIERRDEVLSFVRECWEKELGYSDFGNEDGFFEVGGNSINIVSLKEKLSTRYDYISVADLFCYPSVRTQTDYIMENNIKTEVDNTQVLDGSNKNVAIIGIGLRLADVHDFSGAKDIFEKGIECGRTIYGQRKKDAQKQLRELGIPDKNYRFSKTASLDRIDLFDYEYFKIGKDEACAMDPAQRLLLSVVDDAITDTGISKEKLRETNCSVILSSPTDIGFNSYLDTVYPLFKQNAPLNAVNSSIAGRIQHFYNLHGPAYMVDSACSSGLVAMHNACLAINNNECDMAIVGGVNILDTVDYAGQKRADVLSAHYFAAPFSRNAEGTSRGEGCICFVLESYEKAIANNHHIYGKIRGSAANNDGFSSSLTAPNGLMQEAVLKQAWKNAGITANDIRILETHGTATKLGDQIELQSLMNAMKNTDAGHCAISSAKAILGHLDSVSGLLGVLKSLISINYGMYYPTNNYREPIKDIDIIASPFFIPNEPQMINVSPIICGISSFGLSGTNVHVVLEGENDKKKIEQRVYKTNQNPVRCWVPANPERICADDNTKKNYTSKNIENKVVSKDEILQRLSEKVSSLYSSDSVDVDIPLFRMGFDSVSVIQLRLFIQSTFDADIDLSAQNTLTEIVDNIYANGCVSTESIESDSNIIHTDTTVEEIIQKDNSSWYHLQIRSALQKFIDSYCQKTALSRKQLAKKDVYWANGRFMTGYTMGLEDLSYPILASSAKGAKIIDIDGNEYIDFAMGFGSAFFGYSHPYIVEKVKNVLADEVILGALMKKPFEVAERICKVTGLERVSFCNSGTEAIMNLIRIARAVRNKNKIIVFSGSFHGTFDPVYVEKNYWNDDINPAPRSIGTPLHYMDDIIMLSYGTDESLDYIQNHAEELAAVIVEPVQSRHPDLQPKTFIHNLRKITNDKNVLLIFDEVITGFRSGMKGAQGFYDVEADLVSYGKVIGGGYPIGVFGGKAEYLDLIDHRGALTTYGDSGKWVSTGGTFNGHPISIAAADAVLDILEQQGTSIYERINKMTDYIADTLNSFFEENRMDFKVEHFASQFFIVGNDTLKLRILQYLLIYNNVYVWEGGTCFVSAVHTWEHIYSFVDTVKRCVNWIKDNLPGKEEINVIVDERIAGKDYKTLKKLIEKNKSITEISLLSKELQLVLSHNVANHSKHKDCASIKICIPQKIEVNVLQRGVTQIVNAHKHLRSGVYWRRLTQPVQLFYDYVTPKYNFYIFNGEIDEVCVETVTQTRKEKGFVLDEAPLIMFDSFHGEDKTILVISYYNSWFDGWSLDIILNQIQEYLTNNSILQNTMNWEKYLQWRIHGREKAECYWKQKVLKLPLADLTITDNSKWYEYRYAFNDTLISAVDRYCNKNGISKASAYIYCLTQALNWDTVLIDFSGRNIPVDGILNEVGLFSGLAPIEVNTPDQINKEIQNVNAMPLLTLGEIADCMKIQHEHLVSMTYFNTIVILNQDTITNETFGNILEDKSYVHVPLRFYITIDKELLVTTNNSVLSKEDAEKLFFKIEENAVLLEKGDI